MLLGVPTLENAAYEFETDTWGKLLVVSLEFAPRDEAIEWARQLTGKPKYKNHKVIFAYPFLYVTGGGTSCQGRL